MYLESSISINVIILKPVSTLKHNLPYRQIAAVQAAATVSADKLTNYAMIVKINTDVSDDFQLF
jgi:hypothetical protein